MYISCEVCYTIGILEEVQSIMSMTDERKEYIYQYAKENLKRIPLDVPKATYEQIKAHASAHGESVNGFIKRAITEAMERDNFLQQ